jgi:hypothetical protein
MTSIIEILFLLGLGVLLYTFFGYGIIVWIMLKVRSLRGRLQ